jgi:hypothetical protein
VYADPETDQCWIIDYRIYDLERYGKTKLDHVREILLNAVHAKQVPFRGVLMDSWYAERKLMLLIDRLGKICYCPLKCNRRVDASDGTQPYQRVDELTWDAPEQAQGKTIHIKSFPKGHRVQLFRLALTSKRTDYIATNDRAQHDTEATQEVCDLRWTVEQFHRETKQVSGIEKCQCRKQRIQRNHIGCAILVWISLRQVAQETARTIYQAKHELLDD